MEFDQAHVTCLWHGLRFRLDSGICPEAPHYRVRTFGVRVKDGRVWVGPPGGPQREEASRGA
jgi:nitrite reductase/ring-hydroxylating ferredoxin subunit